MSLFDLHDRIENTQEMQGRRGRKRWPGLPPGGSRRGYAGAWYVQHSMLESKSTADDRGGPDDLLIRLNCTGLCMSDVHYMLKDLATRSGQMDDHGVRSPGHEGAGVVVKVCE